MFSSSHLSHHDGDACGCCGASEAAEDSLWQSLAESPWLLAASIALFAAGFFLPSPWGPTLLLASTALAGFPVFREVIHQVQERHFFTMQTLMTLSTLGAIGIGEWDEAAAVVVLFGIGERLEALAAQKARKGIESLLARAPRTALRRENGTLVEIPAEQVRVGDLLDVLPGAMVPTDGTIREGTSSFDESVLTGESRPMTREPGQKVIAGAIAIDGRVQIEATATFRDNTFSRIIRLVEESGAAKAPTQRFIERFARRYTPGVMVCALVVMLLPALGVEGGWEKWFYKGLAVLLIGCPCALIISIPAAITSALSRASRMGVLIKGGEVLERLGQVKSIFLDKTGTVTTGRLQVAAVQPLNSDLSQEGLILLAASVESASHHPIAQAIVLHARTLGIEAKPVVEAVALPGRGAAARLEGRWIEVLSAKESLRRLPEAAELGAAMTHPELHGQTIAVIHVDSVPVGLIALSDTLRAEAQHTVQTLTHELNIPCTLLTGDGEDAAARVGRSLGISWQSSCLPEDKTRLVQESARKFDVAMVGDGINDAPALSAAQVGIALGTGTDVAMETAQVVLARGDLTAMVDAVRLSRKSRTIIFQNIAFALGLKGTFLVMAIAGAATLWMAIVADTGAALLVTINSLRLLGFRRS